MDTACRLAGPADEADLRRILRENPFPGTISLSLEREPNYFHASAVGSGFHQTVVMCDQHNGKLIGMTDRSVTPMWVNGSVREVGYFSGMRADQAYRRGMALPRLVQRGFKAIGEQWHCDGRAPFYLVSIIADNLPARRLLTSGLKGMPRLKEYTRLVTCAVQPVRPKPDLPLPRGLALARGCPDLLPNIVECLNRNGARKQFAPHWTEDVLLSSRTPHLVMEDFFLALDGEQRVVGCLALWDQGTFKQAVVRGYDGALRRFRKTINLLAPVGGWPPLPEVGARLNQCYACFLAIDGDDPAIFASLLRAFYNEATRRKYSYFIIGLDEANPLRRVEAAYHPIQYTSQVYLAAWPDGLHEIDQIDSRPPGLEIAVL